MCSMRWRIENFRGITGMRRQMMNLAMPWVCAAHRVLWIGMWRVEI